MATKKIDLTNCELVVDAILKNMTRRRKKPIKSFREYLELCEKLAKEVTKKNDPIAVIKVMNYDTESERTEPLRNLVRSMIHHIFRG